MPNLDCDCCGNTDTRFIPNGAGYKPGTGSTLCKAHYKEEIAFRRQINRAMARSGIDPSEFELVPSWESLTATASQHPQHHPQRTQKESDTMISEADGRTLRDIFAAQEEAKKAEHKRQRQAAARYSKTGSHVDWLDAMAHLNREEEAARKKEMRRQVRLAYRVGNKVGYSLSTLLDLGCSTKVIRAVYRA